MIQINHLTKTYGRRYNKLIAVDDVSFSVAEGSSVAILGKSGSGKSTLMHAISGLDRPEKGEVLVGETDVLAFHGHALDKFRAKEIGFIFQAFFVEGNENCYANVSLPLEIAKVVPWKRRRKILAALESVDLLEKTYTKARNLSGGQKQRLAIARAIVNEPKLIFADEPTGNLDSVTGQKIIDLLFGLNKHLGSTLFIVTHDEDLAARCQTRIHLKDGKITKIEDATLRNKGGK